MEKRVNINELKPMTLEKQKEAFNMAIENIMRKMPATSSSMFSLGIIMGSFESVCRMVEQGGCKKEAPAEKKIRGSYKKRGPKRLWSKEEDAEIIRNFRMISAKDIGKQIGRTASAVSQRAFYLGLRRITADENASV